MSEIHNIPMLLNAEVPEVVGKASLVGGVITIYLDESNFTDLCERMAEAGYLEGFIISATMKAASPSLLTFRKEHYVSTDDELLGRLDKAMKQEENPAAKDAAEKAKEALDKQAGEG